MNRSHGIKALALVGLALAAGWVGSWLTKLQASQQPTGPEATTPGAPPAAASTEVVAERDNRSLRGVASNLREALPGAPPSSDPEAPAPLDLDERVDESGMTAKQKMESLVHLHDSFVEAMKADDPQVLDIQLGTGFAVATRSVVSILREMGRADYGEPGEIESRGGLVLRKPEPDEWVFAADRARYRFKKGEFPAYDYVRAAVDGSLSEEELLLREEWGLMVESLFEEAVQRIDASAPH